MPPDPFTVEPDFPFHLKVQRLTEELASAQKKLREYEDLYFASHLRAQRAAEELTGAQKKIREYEDLFVTLYYDACEHCKATFRRIAIAGSRPSSELSPSLAADVAMLSPSSEGNCSPHASSSFTLSTQPTRKRRQAPHSGSSTDSENGVTTSRILKRPRTSLPGSSNRQHDTITSLNNASEAEPSPAVFHQDVSTAQIPTFARPSESNVSTSPTDDTQYFAKFHDSIVGKPTLQVKLERVWTHRNLSINSVKFSPDGKYLAVGVADGRGFDSQRTYIYDVTIGKKICRLADRYAERQLPSAFYLSFSPGDGRYLATGHSTGQIVIWQVGKQHVRNAFGAHPVWENNCVDFSPDGRFVVSGSPRLSGVRIWSMRDGSSILLRDRDCEEITYKAVKFSPDGKHVVASDYGGMLRVWKVRTSKLVRKWKAHQDRAFCVAFTPDGRGVVTASYDNTLKYWDLGPLGFGDLGEVQEVLNFVGHTKDVRSIAISPDGRWVISGSCDGSAPLWDIVDASPQCTLLGHENGVSSVDFSRTGAHVVCGSWDGKVSMWRYESRGE